MIAISLMFQDIVVTSVTVAVAAGFAVRLWTMVRSRRKPACSNCDACSQDR